MKNLTLSLTSFTLFAAAAFAQEMPQMPAPAKELEKLSPLIGNWQGEGSIVPAPGVPAQKWRATSTTRRGLGGHWLQADETIEFPGDGATKMPELTFRSVYGYDRETQRYVVHSISNMGEIETAELLLEGNKMVQWSATFAEGKPVLQHWTTEFGGDGYRFVGRESIAGGDFFDHVVGTMKRATGNVTVKPVNAAFTMGPAIDTAPMQRFAKAGVTYAMTGTMVMKPGTPEMPVSATCDVRLLWGGTILEISMKSDPSPAGTYEGWGAIGWDAREKHYVSVWAGSMGETATMVGDWLDGKVVFRQSATHEGTPVVSRGVLEFNADGTFKSESWTSLSGTAAPFTACAFTYTKK